MARRNVIVDDRFGKYNAEVDKAIERSLIETAEHVAEIARTIPSPSGYQISDIQEKTFPRLATYRTRRGLAIDVVNRDFRGLWFEKGTHAHHKGALKKETLARRQTPSGQARMANWKNNGGVAAQRFLHKALAQGRGLLMQRIRENLPG